MNSLRPQMLIDYYKAIEVSSAKMLDAARAADWDGVVRCEGACAILIEQLRHQARVESLDAMSKSEKTQIMRRILQNDAEIRLLAEPWVQHVAESLDGPKYLH